MLVIRCLLQSGCLWPSLVLHWLWDNCVLWVLWNIQLNSRILFRYDRTWAQGIDFCNKCFTSFVNVPDGFYVTDAKASVLQKMQKHCIIEVSSRSETHGSCLCSIGSFSNNNKQQCHRRCYLKINICAVVTILQLLLSILFAFYSFDKEHYNWTGVLNLISRILKCIII